jgi:hypothetical protein
LFEIPGFNRAVAMSTSKTISTTMIPLISIRVAAALNGIVNRGLYIPTSFGLQVDNPVRYALLYRPTLVGASFTAVDATHSGMEYDVTASSVSGGIVIDADFAAAGKNTPSNVAGILGRTLMSLGRTGTSDILTLAAIRSTGTDATGFASLKWKEIR